MIAIVKYNAGNIRSVQNCLNRLGAESIVTDDPNELQRADKVIFPGVGQARSAMENLKKTGLDMVLKSLNRPFLGICLGQQLMCRYSEEGETACLGIFPLDVKKFPPGLKIPHMGWNNLENCSGPLFTNHLPKNEVYFVHSYYCPTSRFTSAHSHHGIKFSAALRKGNFYAVQFHPEKSAEAGERILKNFLEL